MTKLANTRPPYCASCFSAPEGRCVDFEAAYDGPVIPGTPEPVPVDDLILCEACLLEAFVILDPQNQRETIEELQRVIVDLIADNEAKDKMVQGAKSTINELVEHPVKTFTGKPKLIGVTPEVREQITKARYARRGSSAAPHDSPRSDKRKLAEKRAREAEQAAQAEKEGSPA